MDETIKAMIEALKKYGAGFISVTFGKYTIMITDDKDGAEFLINAWDRYVDCEEEPIAYDVEKVVEQLEEERELSYADFDRYVEEVSPCLDAEYDDFFHRGIERAIKIVKGGGVNE